MTLETTLFAGLCAACQHQKIIKSARGSSFIMCGLSKTDARFPKYPLLPVLQCAGYEKANALEEEAHNQE